MNTRQHKGFTLVELMVVVGMIALLAAMAIPTIGKMFSAGADSQAYNLLQMQITAARALAVQEHTFAAMHSQVVNPNYDSDLENTSYTAIMVMDETKTATQNNQTHPFVLSKKFGGAPQQLPGRYACGDLNETDSSLHKFACTTVVFNEKGQAVQKPNGQLVYFENQTGVTPGLFSSLWVNPGVKTGTTGITLFNYDEAVLTNKTPSYYRDPENSQFLSINAYTGQLSERE